MPSANSLDQIEMPSPIQARQKGNGIDDGSVPQRTGKSDGTRKLSRPQDALLSCMDLPLQCTFYPLGFAVEIITNDSDVLVAATESFGHRYLCRGRTALQVRIGISEGDSSECPREPTRREYNHLYSLVADGENQALLDMRTCTNFVWLTRAALNHRLYFRYNFLEKIVYLLLGASVVTDIHAACVSKNGKGILLCGDSGAGKTTLAYACARAGWTYTSDDTCYLINDSDIPRVIGHSHRIRFRPEGKVLFPELESQNVTPRMEGKPSIEIQLSDLPDLHISTAPEVAVHAIVYLDRHSSANTRLTALPTGTATLRIGQELFSAGEIRKKHEARLRILSDVPTYELHYRDLRDAMQELTLLM
jgi:energy-coupling factor transporter ATP-binding protein EcfA2